MPSSMSFADDNIETPGPSRPLPFSALDHFLSGPGRTDRSAIRRRLRREAADLIATHRASQEVKAPAAPSKPAVPPLALSSRESIKSLSEPGTTAPKLSSRAFHQLSLNDLAATDDRFSTKTLLNVDEAVVLNATDGDRARTLIKKATPSQDGWTPRPRRTPRPRLGTAPVSPGDDTPVVGTPFLTEVDPGQAAAAVSNDDDGGDEVSAVDVMTLLDHERLGDLSAKFSAHPGAALTLQQFVHCVKPYLPTTVHGELSVVMGLCKLFDEIDVNGDGTLEWNEFTNYVVDAGMHSSDADTAEMPVDGYERVSIPLNIGRERHEIRVTKLAYFPGLHQAMMWDGTKLQVNVLDGKNLHSVATLPSGAHTGCILAAEYIPSKSLLVTAGNDRRMCLWDPVHQYALSKRYQHPQAQVALQWHDVHDRLYTADDQHAVNVWNMASLDRPVNNLPGQHDLAILDMLLLKNLNLMATASLDATIGLFDIVQNRKSHRLRGHRRGVLSLAYHSEYHCLVSAGYDHKALIWDPYVDKSICSLNGHFNPLISVSTVAGTPQIVTADTSGCVKIWDIRNYACVQTINLSSSDDLSLESAEALAVMPQTKRIIVGGKGGIATYDGLSAAGRYPILADIEPTTIALYNDHFGTIVTSVGRSLKVWDVRTGQIRSVFRNVTEAPITAMAFDTSQKKVIVGDSSGTIRVLNGRNGAFLKICDIPHARCVTALWYASSMKAIVSCSWDGLCRLYDDSDSVTEYVYLRREAQQIEHEVTCACISQSLTLCAAGGAQGRVVLWDYDTNTIEGHLPGHKSEITALAFLDPYPLLMTADQDGNLCMWAVRPLLRSNQTEAPCLFRVVNVVVGVNQPVIQIQFIPDGHQVYTADAAGVCRIWSIEGALFRLQMAPFLPTRDEDRASKATRMEEYEVYRAANKPMMARIWTAEKLIRPGDVKLMDSWQAHQDSIRSMDVITWRLPQQAAGIITTGFDRMVKLWDLRGRPLGALHQGRGESEIKCDIVDWAFRLDTKSRRRRAMDRARTVLDQTRLLEPVRPPK